MAADIEEIDEVETLFGVKPPFPHFGGKSRASSIIWDALGNVDNYVEPFFGSGAILLNRPTPAGTETVNDIDRYLSNFWRAVRADPDSVAEHADRPVNECDLEAVHYHLITKGRDALAALLTDPESFEAKLAGWWCWGACAWIGSGWCSGEGPWQVTGTGWTLRNAGKGVNRKLPHLGDAGQGVNRQLPHLGDAGKGEHPHREHLRRYMRRLSDRLRYVRVACGDWTRVLTPSVTFRHGMTGVVLDPPYGTGDVDYSAGGNRTGIADKVRSWAIENGSNPLLRIAICSYGDAPCPDGWFTKYWTATGGYSSTAAGDTQGKLNRHREVVYFSPACIDVQPSLFTMERA